MGQLEYTRENMIPKTIHYCWFGGNKMPSDLKKCIKSWKKYAPDYDIVEWNESNFDVNSHPFVKTAYEAKAWAFVSDYVRLKVIYEYGGVYLDTDVELIKKPDFLLNNLFYIGVQQNGHLCTTGLGFGAVKFSPVVHDMLSLYDELDFSLENRAALSCPRLNDFVIKKYGYVWTNDIWKSENITVYPEFYFDPYPSGSGEDLSCDETVSIHHYSASWTTGRQRFKRRLAYIIGEDNVLKIKKIIRR